MTNEPEVISEEQKLLERLEQLETRISNLDRLRKSIRLATWCGALLIVFVFGTFVYRLYNQVVNPYLEATKSPEKLQALVEEIVENSRAQQLIESEAKRLVEDLKKEVVPALQASIEAEAQILMKEGVEQSAKSLERLQVYTLTEVENRLTEYLLKSSVILQNQIKEKVPELANEDFAVLAEQNKAQFLILLNETIATKYELVEPSLATVRDTIVSFSKEADKNGVTQEAAEALLIDAIRELIAYTLMPEIGKEAL